MDKESESFFTPKVIKFLAVFFIAIVISPGLFLNLPPLNLFSGVNHDSEEISEESSEESSEEYSIIKNTWMTGKTSFLSAIFHAALLMFIIFVLDHFY